MRLTKKQLDAIEAMNDGSDLEVTILPGGPPKIQIYRYDDGISCHVSPSGDVWTNRWEPPEGDIAA